MPIVKPNQGTNDPMPPDEAKRLAVEYRDLERRCASAPEDASAFRRMLQLFVALGQPEALPGSGKLLPARKAAPRVAVVTPYSREPLALLERCHRSVRHQSAACTHIFVADGHARDELDGWDVRHVRLPVPSANSGDTPRRIAGELAVAERFDAVAYLDADNWLRPRHVESLLAASVLRGAAVCHSARTLHRADGTMMAMRQRGDNVDHVDTSCVLVAAPAFELLPLWGRWPAELSPIGDRLFWQAVRAKGFAPAFTGALTSCYEATHVGFYRALGEEPPPGTRPDTDVLALIAWHQRLPAETRAQVDERCGFALSAGLAWIGRDQVPQNVR
jgi:hypothetical protein